MFKPTLVFCLLIVYVSAYGCGRRHEDGHQHDHDHDHDRRHGHRPGSYEHDDDRHREGYNKPREYDTNQIGREDSGRETGNSNRGRNDNSQRDRNDNMQDERTNNLDERFGGNRRESNNGNQYSRDDDANSRYREGRGGYDRGHNTRY